MNELTIVGNVTRDPELRFGEGSGTPWCTFSVAVNHRKKDGDQWVDAGTDYFNCKAFGSLAENIADSCPKGTRVVVAGRLELRSFEHNGEKKISADLTVDAAGPDLRWANATVVKSTSSGGSPAPTQQVADDGEEPF